MPPVVGRPSRATLRRCARHARWYVDPSTVANVEIDPRVWIEQIHVPAREGSGRFWR